MFHERDMTSRRFLFFPDSNQSVALKYVQLQSLLEPMNDSSRFMKTQLL